MSLNKLISRLLTGICLAVAAESVTVCAASANLDLARRLNQAFIEVAEKVSPAVVVIKVVQKTAAMPAAEESSSSLDSLPPEFRRYFHSQFGDQVPDTVRGEGSGVIIREDGYILTNGHVVEGAQSIRVRLKDGRSFPATMRGLDLRSDLAVIKIEARKLPVAVLADSSKTRVGEFAIAIGSPFELDYTVTFGHVSAKGRSNVLEGYGAATMEQDYIQTDALMNPGNSGGPLVNIDGEVIGINTMIRGLRSGIGFAVPSNLAREVADQLIATGKFTRAWLGLGIRGLRELPNARDSFKGVEDGVLIERILPGGPASKSQLAQGDIIMGVDGRSVATVQQLRGEIRGKKIGRPVTLAVYRFDGMGQGKKLQVKIEPAEWIETPATLASSARSPELARAAELGLTIHPITPEMAKQFGAESTRGVVVIAVDKDTPAARKGVKTGDIISAVDEETVASPKEFRDALNRADLKKGVSLRVISGGKARVEVLKESGE